MRELPPLGPRGLAACLAIVLLAAALRLGFLIVACEGGAAAPAIFVQGSDRSSRELIRNLRDNHWFGAHATLADEEEVTGHLAPGYFQLATLLGDNELRRLQAGLGVLTVLFLFLHARHAFGSNLAAACVGLLAAVHPTWIVNLGEIADGTVVTFALAASLWLGSQGMRSGEPLTSLLFGLSLAGMCLVRASLLPVAFFALAWFLLGCRRLRLGWFAGLLALLGFSNGLAPWTVRNVRVFHESAPVVTSAYLHLWIGSMPGASGGPVDETDLRASLPQERTAALLAEPNQARRYDRLSHDLVRICRDDPGGVLNRRISALQAFLFGGSWHRRPSLVQSHGSEGSALDPLAEAAAAGTLLLVLPLALLGWRRSAVVGSDCRFATLVLWLVPLPYILTHGESFSGPRLPWEAALILFAGYALASLIRQQRGERAKPVG